jgi:hypothetical protein
VHSPQRQPPTPVPFAAPPNTARLRRPPKPKGSSILPPPILRGIDLRLPTGPLPPAPAPPRLQPRRSLLGRLGGITTLRHPPLVMSSLLQGSSLRRGGAVARASTSTAPPSRPAAPCAWPPGIATIQSATARRRRARLHDPRGPALANLASRPTGCPPRLQVVVAAAPVAQNRTGRRPVHHNETFHPPGATLKDPSHPRGPHPLAAPKTAGRQHHKDTACDWQKNGFGKVNDNMRPSVGALSVRNQLCGRKRNVRGASPHPRCPMTRVPRTSTTSPRRWSSSPPSSPTKRPQPGGQGRGEGEVISWVLQSALFPITQAKVVAGARSCVRSPAALVAGAAIAQRAHTGRSPSLCEVKAPPQISGIDDAGEHIVLRWCILYA